MATKGQKELKQIREAVGWFKEVLMTHDERGGVAISEPTDGVRERVGVVIEDCERRILEIVLG